MRWRGVRLIQPGPAAPCRRPTQFETPGEPYDEWVPLGMGSFQDEDGCVSACSCLVAWSCVRPSVASSGWKDALQLGPLSGYSMALTPSLSTHSPAPAQGGGRGELHLRCTYWPFDKLSGHSTAAFGAVIINLYRCVCVCV